MKQSFTLLVVLIFSSRIFAGTGGPDVYGYTWKDSDEPDGPLYSWIDVTSFPNATEVKLLGDDNSRGPFNMNFNFHYFWYDVNQFWVGSNGYVMFQDGQIASPFSTFPNSLLPNDALGAFLNDLTFLGPDNPGECWYYLNAAHDTFIISWINVPFFDTNPNGYSGSNTFQIILSALDSSITYQYNAVDPFSPYSGSSSVGMENYTGLTGLQWPAPFTYQTPNDNFAIKFYYPHPPLVTTVIDAAVLQNDNPSTGGVFVVTNGNPYPLTTKVRNYSMSTVNPFNVFGRVIDEGGNLVVQEDYFTDTLLSSQIEDITYNSQFIPADEGTYRFVTLSMLPNDPAGGNNKKTLEIVAVDSTQDEMWLGYDGGQTNGLAGLNWIGGSGGAGNYYVPPFYPIAITKLHYFITSFFSTDAFSARVFDDDGVTGLPFTMLDSVYVPSTDIVLNGWTDITLASPIIINSGGFYLAWDEIGTSIILGCGTQEPLSNRSYELFQNIWGIFRYRETQDPMIAATVEKYSFPTGIQNPDSKSLSLSVMPNPATDQVSMLYNLQDARAQNVIQICDVHGKLIQSISLGYGAGSHQMTVDVSSLPSGIYFATLMSGKEKSVQKLVITE